MHPMLAADDMTGANDARVTALPRDRLMAATRNCGCVE